MMYLHEQTGLPEVLAWSYAVEQQRLGRRARLKAACLREDQALWGHLRWRCCC